MKRIISWALILAMVSMLFVGCGALAESEEPDEIIEINYLTWEAGDGTAGSNTLAKEVEAAINEIAEKEIGVHVNFTWVNAADYGTRISLDLLDGVQYDVADYYSWPLQSSFPQLFANNSMTDITELAAEYAPETLEMFGADLLQGTSANGRLYGIPAYRVQNTNFCIMMRRDILEQLNLVEKAQNMKTWAEFEEIMAAVKDSGFTGYATGGGGGFGMTSNNGCIYQGENIVEDSVIFDPLCDTFFSIAIDENGKVVNQVAMEETQNQFKMFKKWMDAGYMYPDSAFDSTGAKELFNQGVLFSVFVTAEFGAEQSWKASSGYDCLCYTVGGSPLNTSAAQKFGVFIPNTSKEPEAAMKWINLLYTNKDIMNLITWGIEGKSYEVIDGSAHYINGADAVTSGYHNNDYKIGNSFLCLPWDNDADFREASLAHFKAAPISPYFGLNVDTTDYSDLVAQISAVCSEFHGQMCGGFYTDELYQQYLDKLAAAGIDQYIELLQAAVDGFNK